MGHRIEDYAYSKEPFLCSKHRVRVHRLTECRGCVREQAERDLIERAKAFMQWCPSTPEYERDYRLLEEAVEAYEKEQG